MVMTMKLSRIPGHEATAKQSWALKVSTVNQLQAYHDMYVASTGADVSLKDVVEQMLLDFMGDDKAFQKAYRQKLEATAAAAQAAPAASAPAVSAAPAVHAQPRFGHERAAVSDSSGE
jgi:hypothetical protein